MQQKRIKYLGINLPKKTKCFPGGTNGKEPTCQCRRCKRQRFDPRVRKIPWKRKWQPTLVFLPGESHGHRSPWGRKRVRHNLVTEQQSVAVHNNSEDVCGLPRWLGGKESDCQCRRYKRLKFNP